MVSPFIPMLFLPLFVALNLKSHAGIILACFIAHSTMWLDLTALLTCSPLTTDGMQSAPRQLCSNGFEAVVLPWWSFISVIASLQCLLLKLHAECWSG